MSDWISKLKNQEITGGGGEDADLWGNLGAGGYSAIDEILMGLPSFLVKNVGGKDTWNKLDAFRKEHKLASDIGGGAGFIGSMLIPGGAIAKGAGKLAKFAKLGKLASKLDKAGDIAKMSTKGLKGFDALKVGAKAGAVQALEQAIPRAITGLEGVTPWSGYSGEELAQSAGKGLKDIGTGAAFGGVTGGTLGRLFNKAAPHVQTKLDDIGEAADKMILQQIGLDTRGVRKFYGGSGKGFQGKKVLESFDPMMKETADIARNAGLKYEANQQPFIDKIDDVWESISANYNKLGQPPTIAEVAKTPRMADLLDTFAGEEDKVQKIAETYINKVNKLPTAGIQRKFLGDVYSKVSAATDPDSMMRGQVALAIKDAIKDKINATTDAAPELVKEANRLFPIEQMLIDAMGKKKTLMNAGIKGGSDTFGKLFGQSLAGGTTGFIASGGNPEDQDFAKKKIMASLIGGAGGLLGGGILNKIGTSAAGNVLEKAADVIGNKLPIAKIVSEAVPSLPGKIAGALPSKLGQEEEPITAGEGGGGASSPEDAKASIVETEAGADPIVKEEAKQEFTEAYKSTIKKQLVDGWERFYKNDPNFAGVTFEQFAQMVAKKTNNFDPVKSSKVLFPDNPEMESAYLQKYETMLYLKNLDAEKALSKDPGILGFGGGYEDEGNYQKIRDLMINIASGGKIENMDSKTMQNMVDEDLGKAMKVKGMRKAALMEILGRKYGLDFADLAEMGLL